MSDIYDAILLAFQLIISLDSNLLEIVMLSLYVSGFAIVISSIVGIPLGAILAISRFPGRTITIVFVNALMGLPPVVVGLTVYLFLSRSGPLGVLGLLYTPTAMIIAQTLLILPIIIALSRQVILDSFVVYDEQLRSFGFSKLSIMTTLIVEARFALITVVLAGMGRAIAEVGAVLIVGGNINHATRVMTTAITLETSKGNLALAMALGLILIFLAVIINACMMLVRLKDRRSSLQPV